MGVLYRAQDPVLERDVAIKVMSADFSDDEVGRSRFYREARAVARLQHRNIVTLYDFGEEQGSPFIVMEFLRGQTLAARLRTGPPLSVDEALDIAAQLGTGLHFAHAHGIIHRDVKPANIWLLDDGGVKLLDFGIAKFGESTLTTAGDVVGSVSYMSPEQLSGAPVDSRSDIFSAGIVLYELLTGRRPFHGDTPTAIMMRIIHDDPPPIDNAAALPAGLSDIVRRALEKSPDRRYQHGAELASDLQGLRSTMSRGVVTTRAGLMTATVAVPLPPSSPSHTPSRSSGPVASSSRPQSLIETGEEEDAAANELVRSDIINRVPAPAPEELDLVGDVPIGDLAPTPRPFRAPSTGARRWLPAGAAAGALLAAVVGFLIVRDSTSDVSGNPGTKTAQTAAGTSAAGYRDSGGAAAGKASGGGSKASADRDGDSAKEREASARAAAAERERKEARDAARERAAAERDTPAARATEPPATSASSRRAAERRAEPPDEDGPSPARGSPLSQVGFIVLVTGTYPFEVITESGVTSRKSMRHELTLAGKQTIRLRAPEYALDRRVPVNPPPGRGELRLTAPALGRFTLRASDEMCEVLANGRSLGFPPIVEQPLASGSYHIVLSCPGGEKRTETVQIAAGRTETLLIR